MIFFRFQLYAEEYNGAGVGINVKLSHKKIEKKVLKNRDVWSSRESNPGQLRGDQDLYHYATGVLDAKA